MLACAYFRNRVRRILRETGGGIRFGGIDDVDQMMRNAHTRGRIRLRGSDVHAAVDLGGVDANDLAMQAKRQLERERALARRGRPHQQNRRYHDDATFATQGRPKSRITPRPGTAQRPNASMRPQAWGPCLAALRRESRPAYREVSDPA